MKRSVAALALLDMLLVGYTYLRIPVLDRLIPAAGITKAYAGAAFGVYSALGAIGMPLRGFLADSLERRKPVIASLASLTVLGTLLIVSAEGGAGIILGMALAGLGSLGVYPVGYVLISDIAPPKYRATAYSLRAIINGLGQAVVAAYAIIFGTRSIRLAAYAYSLSIILIAALYSAVGAEIRPSAGRRKPRASERISVIRSNELDKALLYFVAIYAIPRGALQVRSITYFVESRGMNEVLGSVMLGLLAAPALLSFPLVMLVDYFYNERRLRVRPISAALAIAGFALLFSRFFSISYSRSRGLAETVDEALRELVSAIATDPSMRRAFLVGSLAFLLAGLVGPIKNGILADGNLPEHRGVLYASLSIIDTLSRGLGAATAGFAAEKYSLGHALSLLPLLRIPSAVVMLRIASILPKAYKNVSEELGRRLSA